MDRADRLRPRRPSRPPRSSIFHTCFVNYYKPNPGKALVTCLAKNNCAIASPAQNCCGMPALDGGDVEFAQKQARANMDTLLPLVRKGYRIAAINPTCSLTCVASIRRWSGTPEATESSPRRSSIRAKCLTVRRAGKFNRDFQTTPGKVAYHVPCHLKAQEIGLRGAI